MDASLSRRDLFHVAGAAALRVRRLRAPVCGRVAGLRPDARRRQGHPQDLPGRGRGHRRRRMRRLAQIGVGYVLTGGPRMPWTEADIRGRMEQYKAGGLTLCNLMISGFDDVIWGRPGADAADRERHPVDSCRRQGRPAR